jgi:broad specificity phosphatase PhoE
LSRSLPDTERGLERPQAGHVPASGVAPLIPPGLDAVIVLVRHGETELIVEGRFQGQTETPLTPRGERQVRGAAIMLAHPRGDLPLPVPDTAPFLIAHSPLWRTRRSAELIAEELSAAGRATPPLRPEPGLLEIAQGEWEGLTGSEISARFGDALGNWRRWPERAHAAGGESLAEVGMRVDATLARLLAELADGGKTGTFDRDQVLGYGDGASEPKRWALLVGHGGVFRVVVCALLELPLEHFWNFDFGLAAISVVDIRAGRAVLRGLNFEAPQSDDDDEAGHRRDAERNAKGAL